LSTESRLAETRTTIRTNEKWAVNRDFELIKKLAERAGLDPANLALTFGTNPQKSISDRLQRKKRRTQRWAL
jgi:hypothetical protein